MLNLGANVSRLVLFSLKTRFVAVFIAQFLVLPSIAIAGGAADQADVLAVPPSPELPSSHIDIAVASFKSSGSYFDEHLIRLDAVKAPLPASGRPLFTEWTFSPLSSAPPEAVSFDAKLPSVLFASTESDIVARLKEDGSLIPIADFYESAILSYGQNYAVGEYRFEDRHLFPAGRFSLRHFRFSPSDYLAPNYMINSKWIENLGLQLPRTEHDLRDVLSAFHTQDPNGNGIADELVVGFANQSSFQRFRMIYSTWNMPTSNGISYWDGQTHFVPTQPEYREMIEYVSDLYADKLIDQESFDQTFAEFDAKINDPTGNKYGFILAPPDYYSYSEGTQNRDDFIPVSLVRDGEGNTRLMYNDAKPVPFGWFLTRENHRSCSDRSFPSQHLRPRRGRSATAGAVAEGAFRI